MKFLGFFTPQNIAEMCKEGKVMVTITVYDRIGEEVIHFENGKQVVRIEDKILSETSREIRSWKDLIQLDNSQDIWLSDKVKESLK